MDRKIIYGMEIVLAMHHRYLLVIMLTYLFCYLLFIGRTQLLLLFICWLFSSRLAFYLSDIFLIRNLLVIGCLQSILGRLVIYLLDTMYLFMCRAFTKTWYYIGYEIGISPSHIK